MPDRAPRVVLQSGAFVLPKGDAPRLSVGTVNLSAVAVKLYRVGERGLAGQIGDTGRAFRSLSQWSAQNLAEGGGRLLWEGALTVGQWERNVLARTVLDLAPMLAGAAPGLFALTAAPGDGTPFPSWGEVATQWFVLTDIGLTVLRGAIYRYGDEDRRQRAARYLAMRIDRDTTAEDVQLTIWSNESMRSRAFEGFFLSDLEYGVRTHHDHLRALLPVLDLENAPPDKDMASRNAALLAQA